MAYLLLEDGGLLLLEDDSGALLIEDGGADSGPNRVEFALRAVLTLPVALVAVRRLEAKP